MSNRQIETLIRIDRAWRDMPELRLGQLLVNATRGHDLFYVEDAELERLVKAFGAAHRSDNEVHLTVKPLTQDEKDTIMRAINFRLVHHSSVTELQRLTTAKIKLMHQWEEK